MYSHTHALARTCTCIHVPSYTCLCTSSWVRDLCPGGDREKNIEELAWGSMKTVVYFVFSPLEHVSPHHGLSCYGGQCGLCCVSREGRHKVTCALQTVRVEVSRKAPRLWEIRSFSLREPAGEP